jgi:hypothetical protein
MDIQYKWIVSGLGKSKQYLFEFDLPYVFEGADQIRESHPEYICVRTGLIRETGDEDDQTEIGFAYITKQDGKWVLPTHFSYSGVSNDTRFTVPEQYHKELAETQ